MFVQLFQDSAPVAKVPAEPHLGEFLADQGKIPFGLIHIRTIEVRVIVVPRNFTWVA